MSRRADLDRRLDAHFATLNLPPLARTLRRRLAAWQIYAAVGSSAMAMTVADSASLIRVNSRVAPDPTPGIREMRHPPASSRSGALPDGILLASARQPQQNSAPAAVHGDVVQLLPYINPGGVVPIYGKNTVIQSGEWISIYGQNLANQVATWNGDFPKTLGGTSVSIDGKPAYLWYVSPGQLNVQVPDDAAMGPVSVLVTTGAGTATGTVTLGPVAPALSLLSGQYVAGIIIRNNGRGLYGNGSYDVLGPTGNSLGYATVGAEPGDVVEIYAVGLGPTNPVVHAGQAFFGSAPIATSDFSLTINGVQVRPTFVGLSSAGLYQINFVVPQGLVAGEVPIVVQVGGMQTQPGILFSLGQPPPAYSSNPYYSSFFYYAVGPKPAAHGLGGSGGGTAVGAGGLGALRKRYAPKLKFPSAAETDAEDA